MKMIDLPPAHLAHSSRLGLRVLGMFVGTFISLVWFHGEMGMLCLRDSQGIRAEWGRRALVPQCDGVG